MCRCSNAGERKLPTFIPIPCQKQNFNKNSSPLINKGQKFISHSCKICMCFIFHPQPLSTSFNILFPFVIRGEVHLYFFNVFTLVYIKKERHFQNIFKPPCKVIISGCIYVYGDVYKQGSLYSITSKRKASG